VEPIRGSAPEIGGNCVKTSRATLEGVSPKYAGLLKNKRCLGNSALSGEKGVKHVKDLCLVWCRPSFGVSSSGGLTSSMEKAKVLPDCEGKQSIAG